MQTNLFTIYSNSSVRSKVDNEDINDLIMVLDSFKSAKEARAYITSRIGFQGINSIYFSSNRKLEVKETSKFYKVEVSLPDEKLVFSYKK